MDGVTDAATGYLHRQSRLFGVMHSVAVNSDNPGRAPAGTAVQRVASVIPFV